MPKMLMTREEQHKALRKEALAWLGKMYCLEYALLGDHLPVETAKDVEKRLRWLHGALDLLPEDEKRMLLCMADGCSIDDLCELFAREKSSVYALRKRAIDRLTVALYGYCDDGKRHG